ncbi:MAG TPA: hypothetical protein VF543_07665 [Pyrinomonadaceae bacterium]|jgi:hypothetical protein
MTNSAFEWTISVGDIVSTLGILIGVLLAVCQLHKANKQSRAEFIIGLLANHVSDNDTLNMLYKLEYEKFEFDEKKFPMSDEEKALDKLLYSFTQISTLYKMKTITRRDLALIEYDFLRVYSNQEVQKYFEFLDRTPHHLATDQADFCSYRQVAKELIEEHERKIKKELVSQ